MANLVEQFIKSLKALGVKFVFGIPGGPSIPFLEAMRKHGIEFVLVSNEQSAGMMADVCGRLTGVPGVCHGTFGPGATNLSTGVGGALLDRSPLIALTTEVKDEDIGRRVQMNIDHQALYQPITKWTTRLSGENFQETISNAFGIATAEVPGPVHIGLPANIDGEIGNFPIIDHFEKEMVPFPDSILLEEAKKVLEKAKKPLLAVGLTAARHGVHPLIREFVNKNNIPVVLTPMAKGVLSENHPCYAGVIFHAQSDVVASVYRKADLIIGLGYDSIEFNYEAWIPDVPLIHIDTEPVDIPPEYQVVSNITGDLRESVTYLNTLNLPTYEWDLQEIKENKEKVYQMLKPQTKTFTPSDLFIVLQEEMPKDGILTADVGAHLHLLGQLWKVQEPNRFIMTNGWSSMGFGIPSAIGAKLCKPESTVVCVTGDGGFLMNCGELLTARRLGINVVILVLCDHNLSLIEVKQDWKQVAQYGTGLYEGEYFAADQFLGVPILKVTDEREARDALQKAFSMAGPVIIEAVVDGSGYKNLITRSFK